MYGTRYLISGVKYFIITILLISGNAYSLVTPAGVTGADWMMPKWSSLEFSVQACNDAVVTLATSPADTSKNVYEITIGANNMWYVEIL